MDKFLNKVEPERIKTDFDRYGQSINVIRLIYEKEFNIKIQYYQLRDYIAKNFGSISELKGIKRNNSDNYGMKALERNLDVDQVAEDLRRWDFDFEILVKVYKMIYDIIVNPQTIRDFLRLKGDLSISSLRRRKNG